MEDQPSDILLYSLSEIRKKDNYLKQFFPYFKKATFAS